MSITVKLRYTGKGGSARKFAEEMVSSGTVAAIRNEAGNLRYEYYESLDDPETILLIDSWENQEAIDVHHALYALKIKCLLEKSSDLRKELFCIISVFKLSYYVVFHLSLLPYKALVRIWHSII